MRYKLLKNEIGESEFRGWKRINILKINYTLSGLDTQVFRGWEGLANSFIVLEIQRNRWKE